MESMDWLSSDVRRLSNEESNKLTRECIRTALIYLLANKELDQINITEIVKKAGVSRATFYRNYATKENVVKDIVQEAITLLQTVVADPLFKKDSRTWLINIFRNVRENNVIYGILLKSGISHIELFDPSTLKNLNPNMTRVQEYRFIGYLCGLLAIILDWIDHQMLESDEEMAEIALSVFKEVS